MKLVSLYSTIKMMHGPINIRLLRFTYYSRTPLIWINWDSELSGYAENPHNLIFL